MHRLAVLTLMERWNQGGCRRRKKALMKMFILGVFSMSKFTWGVQKSAGDSFLKLDYMHHFPQRNCL